MRSENQASYGISPGGLFSSIVADNVGAETQLGSKHRERKGQRCPLGRGYKWETQLTCQRERDQDGNKRPGKTPSSPPSPFSSSDTGQINEKLQRHEITAKGDVRGIDGRRVNRGRCRNVLKSFNLADVCCQGGVLQPAL